MSKYRWIIEMLKIPGYSDKTAKERTENRYEQTSTPEVGIFWIDGNSLVMAEKCTLANAVDRSSIKTNQSTHQIKWAEFKSYKNEWKDKTYAQVPRGRVVYSTKDDKFLIFLPPEAKSNKELLDEIKDTFNIPEGKAEFVFEYEVR